MCLPILPKLFECQEDPLEEGMATTPVFLTGESQGQRSLVGCHLWGRTESDMTEATYHRDYLGLEDLFCTFLLCILAISS